jgi:EmrB/QacA subfamily drug resistance transporter
MPAATSMSRRQILEALSGLMLGLFFCVLSSTIVAASLPQIIGDLGGTQADFTWVVSSYLLATTVSSLVWGKLSDLVDRKMLVQLALGFFTLGSMLSGLAPDTHVLIACRVVQGIGGGGVAALVQVVLADLLSPRERGRYLGIQSAVTAVPTLGGPLIGGLVTGSLGWRWNFYIAVPFAVAAIVLLQRTLHLPVRRRQVRIDYAGIVLTGSGVTLLMVWISAGGQSFAWSSRTSGVLLGASLLLLAAAVFSAFHTAEPLMPPRLFRNRTQVLSVTASFFMGIVLYSASIFLSQYFQLARGHTAAESGLLITPLTVGSLVASIGVGQLVTRTGVWKPFVVGGLVTSLLGIALLGGLHRGSPVPPIMVFMFMVGLGLGASLQNLVLAVQNSVAARDLGVASTAVSFFRNLGGSIGVVALGAILGAQVSRRVQGVPGTGGGGTTIPDLSQLSAAARLRVETAYGEAIGRMFLLGAPVLVVAVVAAALLPNLPLGTRTGLERRAQEESVLGLTAGSAVLSPEESAREGLGETETTPQKPDV